MIQASIYRIKVSMRILRAVGCTLPVEIFHYENEHIDDDIRQDIEALGGTILSIPMNHRTERDYRIKPAAMVHSSFQQVLFLDADNVVVSDPTPLFSHPTFMRHGAAFWPDTYKFQPENAAWRIVGEVCNMEHFTFETGQMMVDKKARGGMTLAALYVTVWMNRHTNVWYQMSWGDKDTFAWAWRALDLSWASPGSYLGYTGSTEQTGSGKFCGQ